MGIFNKKNSKIEQIKANVADFAFDTLLKAGENYTVCAKIGSASLVKKQVKWAYFFEEGDKIKALFIIITDKGTYAFQSDGDKMSLIPTELVMSIYKFK